MKKFFSLLFVAIVAFAAQAATTNLYQDGPMTSSEQVPIYGMYMDTPGTVYKDPYKD